MLNSLALAFSLLTRLPVGTTVKDPSSSLAWFPVVGVCVGLVSGGVAFGASALWSAPVGSVLGVITWAGVTGALHLDGLADTTDGYAAAHRSSERGLQAMRDSHIGAHGAVALVLLLLLKVTALWHLVTLNPAGTGWPALLGGVSLCAGLSRASVAWVLGSCPIEPSSQMASSFGRGAHSKRGGRIALALAVLLLGGVCALTGQLWRQAELWQRELWVSIAAGVAVILTAVGVCLGAVRRFGGVTGDVCGAAIELSEVVGLLVWGIR